MEIIKTKVQIKEVQSIRTIEKINETKSWFPEKINNIDKPLATLIRKKKSRTHKLPIRMQMVLLQSLQILKDNGMLWTTLAT